MNEIANDTVTDNEMDEDSEETRPLTNYTSEKPVNGNNASGSSSNGDSLPIESRPSEQSESTGSTGNAEKSALNQGRRDSKVQFEDDAIAIIHEFENHDDEIYLDRRLSAISNLSVTSIVSTDTKSSSVKSHNSTSDEASSTQRRSSLDTGSQRRSSGENSSRRESVATSHMGRSIRSMSAWGGKDDDVWAHQDIQFDDETDDVHYSKWMLCKIKTRDFFGSLYQSTLTTLYTAIHNPIIIVISLLAFAVICIAGLLAVEAYSKIGYNDRVNNAIDTAEKAGEGFSKALEDAGRGPLFALTQFVKHLDYLEDLPNTIGERGQPGAAPPLDGKFKTHRDISGTKCADETVVAKFNEIASTLKKDAELEGILVNIQLAPKAVVCLLYPLNNTEDFSPPLYLDSSGAIGHDLIYDNDRRDGAMQTLLSDDPVIVGPLTLRQGDTPLVKEAFIMRYAIRLQGFNVKVPDNKWDENDKIDYYDTTTYNDVWGFSVVILNWANTKNKVNLYKDFVNKGMDFKLTRTDKKEIDGEIEYVEVMIANSTNWEALNDKNSVNVDLDTTNNMWTMKVGYVDGFQLQSKGGLQALVIIVSLILGILTMIVLVVRRQLQVLLYNMMPPQIINRLRHGETIVQRYENATIFFSDIVGFTSLSGTMTALQVMEMLNGLYTEFDKLVRKHKIYKVETIGDAYIVIGGGPDRCNCVDGAENVAMFALEAIEFVEKYEASNGAKVQIRVGMASGPVVGGVVGVSMPKFTLFGDTVNLASRMESTSETMKIQCSSHTNHLLQQAENMKFTLKQRVNEDGSGISVKGKGQMYTWWITGATLRDSAAPP